MAEFGEHPLAKILSTLGRLFGIFRGRVSSGVVGALEGLRGVLIDVGEGLSDFISETRNIFSSLIGLFRRFYASGLLPLLRWLREKIVALQAWLKRVLKPLFDFLLRIRRELLDVYTKFIRPVLDVIEAVRFGLQVLGRLGVDWARELDRKLGRLEDAIVRNFYTLLGAINRVIDVVDAVVTLDGLFRRVPFLQTLVRDAGLWNRIWWNVNLGAVQPSAGQPDTPEELLPRPPEKDTAELREFFRHGSGPKAGIIRELRSTILAAARGASR